jgi:uroporphyrinogen III methyltransferase/synthase
MPVPDNQIPFQEVPGITSAISVPAYAGIPVTHRKLCSTMGIITGHEDPTKTESSIHWDQIATGIDTLIFLMGVENLPNIVEQLIIHGRSPQTPIALIRWGTLPKQETLTGTLEDIVEKVQAASFKSPAVTVVGEVVHLRDKLRWFDNRPLFGKKILVTRAREQASSFSQLLDEAGAEVIEFPVIKIEPLPDTSAADHLTSKSYDWILFTSINAVSILLSQLRETGHDIRALGSAKLGAIGPATAEALNAVGLKVDFIPTEFVAEKVIEQFPEDPRGLHILIPRAQDAREVLPDKLTERGAEVEVVVVYRTIPDGSGAEFIREQLAADEIDVITFTSSSTVTHFIKAIGEGIDLSKLVIASIGPITTETAEKNGLHVDIQPEEYTIPALAAAIETYFRED